MADAASRATVKTVGGALLFAFVGAFVALCVYGRTSSDIPTGFAFYSSPESLSFNEDGSGSLAPADSGLENAPTLPERLAAVKSRAPPAAVNQKSLDATVASSPSKPGAIRSMNKKLQTGHPAANGKAQSPPHIGKQLGNDLKQQQAKRAQRLVNHNKHETAKLALKPATSVHKNQLVAKQHASARMSAAMKTASAVRKIEDRIANDIVDAFKCTVGTGCLERSLTNAEKDAGKIFSGPLFKAIRQPSQTIGIPILGPEIPVVNGAESKHFWQEAAQIAKKGPERKNGNSAATFVKQMAAARQDTGHAVATSTASTKGPMSRTNDKTFK